MRAAANLLKRISNYRWPRKEEGRSQFNVFAKPQAAAGCFN
jgi:hypothetical protein